VIPTESAVCSLRDELLKSTNQIKLVGGIFFELAKADFWTTKKF
jgi:hypothetical protein